MPAMSTLILLNKPYGVLSQFTAADGHCGLASLIRIKGVYPAGRLDQDSEGLLLLTDDGTLQARISHPRYKLPKTYWVQVEGIPTEHQIQQLSAGVELKDGKTAPARVTAIPPPAVWMRTPPVRFRKTIPTSWLELTITEGRNRQVRRMTAAVGLPTLRLIRVRIGEWTLDTLQPGEHRVVKVHAASQNRRPQDRVASGRRRRKPQPRR